MSFKGGGKGKGGKGKGSRFGHRAKEAEEGNWRDGEAPKDTAPPTAVAAPRIISLQSVDAGLPPSEPVAVKKPLSAPRMRRKTSTSAEVKDEIAVVHSRSSETRIANGNLSLPWVPEKLSIESQAVLDELCASSEGVCGTAWVPMVDLSGSQSDPHTGSFFGGSKVLMKQGTEWPVCLDCKEPLLIICQIDRASLLHPFQGRGLVQVFACIKCARLPGPKARTTTWANVVDLKTGDAPESQHVIKEFVNASVSIHRLRRIVKWLPRKDCMHPEDMEERLGKPLSERQWAVAGEAQVRGDKVGGFPCWLREDAVSQKQRLKCRVCDAKMRLLFAVDSGDNVPLQWGRDGCLLVFECENHYEQVTALMMSCT